MTIAKLLAKTALSATVITLASISSLALACDEQCLKEKAEVANNVKFPSYLTAKYCEDTAMQFVSSTVKSLETYREEHMSLKYKKPMRNTKNFIAQRSQWLHECENYMTLTHKTHVFGTKEQTDAIFVAMNKIENEMQALINGVTYSSNDQLLVLNTYFDTLFKQVDDHKTMMHLKGRYVAR